MDEIKISDKYLLENFAIHVSLISRLDTDVDSKLIEIYERSIKSYGNEILKRMEGNK